MRLIRQSVEHHLHIGTVRPHPFDDAVYRLIQRIDDLLLDIPVKIIIQRIDTDRFIKDLLKPLPDIRHGESNDRKTALLPFDIFVGDLPCPGSVLHGKLLLLFGQLHRRLFILRRKISLPEDLHHRRPRMHVSPLFIALKTVFQQFQFPVH